MPSVCYYVWPFKGLTNYYRCIEKASGHKLSICGACYRPHLTTLYNTVVLCGDSIIATGVVQSTGRLYLEVLADQLACASGLTRAGTYQYSVTDWDYTC